MPRERGRAVDEAVDRELVDEDGDAEGEQDHGLDDRALVEAVDAPGVDEELRGRGLDALDALVERGPALVRAEALVREDERDQGAEAEERPLDPMREVRLGLDL